MQNIYRAMAIAGILLLSGCNVGQQGKDSQLALVKTTNPKPIVTDGRRTPTWVEEIKREVSSYPELYDVAVVKGQEGTLVVYKVKHLHRFKMKQIEKDVTKFLEKKHPKEKFTVSSDYKIFLEAVRLDEKMKSPKFPKKKAEKRFKELVKMTEDTK
ncbi:sporulation protein [Bacillus sp. FJAT-29814]|uniref:sporulation protein n=1 Tax=Bacillus sp. FJAT-29814 TaxID=1729688 RepID=UPI00082E714E|nr:sporulation protein [Bacillus sp. FJAT-29814]